MKTLIERNQDVIAKVLKGSEENKRFAEAMKRDYQLDIWDEKKFPIHEAGFSFKAMRETMGKKMKEADVSSSFPQLLRAGILTVASKGYQMAQTTFEQFARVVPSNKDTELYAPSHGVGFPNLVPQGGLFPEVGAATLNLSLKNNKYGTLYSVSKELLNDDQTGQIQEGASLLGQYLKTLTEVLVYGKIASVANMQYADYSIPTSETKPSNEANWPWAAPSAPLIGGGVTRPAAYGLPGVDTFQAAQVQLISQKNLQGLKMGIVPDTIIHGPQLAFTIATLLNSQFYPINTGTAGAIGGLASVNPVKGLYEPICSAFMFKQDGTVNGDSKAWYVTDKKKVSFLVQLRDAVQVEQEAPNSGASFERDIYRFKGSMRGNADFVDARFWFQGNDGSVTT
jgi:hypothetical protein